MKSLSIQELTVSLPSFFTFPSQSPLHSLSSWTTNRTTNRMETAKQKWSLITTSASFPDAIPYSQAAWGLGTTVLAYGTAFQLQGLQPEGAPMAEGLPEKAKGIGGRRKTTETETRSPLSTVYACTVRFPPKFETADSNQ